MLGLTKQVRVARKDDYLKSVYEENLVVAGKRKPQPATVRRIHSPPHKSPRVRRHPSFYFLLLIITAAVAYSALFTFWSFPRNEFHRFDDNATADTSAVAPAKVQVSSAAPVTDPDVLTMDQVIDSVYAQPKPSSPMENATPETINQLKSLVSADGPPLARLFGLGVHTIVIDPGHGGKDPGAIGHLGSHEADITLEIAKRLRDRLQVNDNYNVLLTRETDEFLSLSERVTFANDNHADIFISVHINYYPGDQLNFVETYYFGPNNDRKVAELAAKENADSQYRYAEFKEMVEKIGNTMKFQESRGLADSVQEALYPQIRKVNKKARNHGIKPGPFVVLLGIDAPSILTEVTSLSNKQEEERLKSPAYRDKIAAFLEKGIVNYLNKTTNSPGGEPNGNGEEKENLAQAKNNKYR
ncbi:MAG: N-acetylmuramoyl-L-alanine amidase [Gammaproteobacteria bacterium]|jgi:N-acetylmuramoyl-L-alanine amidase